MAQFALTALPALVVIAICLQLATCTDTFNTKLGDEIVSAFAKKMNWKLMSGLVNGAIKFRCVPAVTTPNPQFDMVFRVVKIVHVVKDQTLKGEHTETIWESTQDPPAEITDAQTACNARNLAAWPKPDGWTDVMTVDECKRYVLIVLSSKCATMTGKRFSDLTPVRELFTKATAVTKSDLATPSQ